MYIYNVNKTRTITLYNMSDIKKKELKELEEIMIQQMKTENKNQSHSCH